MMIVTSFLDVLELQWTYWIQYVELMIEEPQRTPKEILDVVLQKTAAAKGPHGRRPVTLRTR